MNRKQESTMTLPSNTDGIDPFRGKSPEVKYTTLPIGEQVIKTLPWYHAELSCQATFSVCHSLCWSDDHGT